MSDRPGPTPALPDPAVSAAGRPRERAGAAAEVAGTVLGAVSSVAARLRRTGRPLHPRGALFTGTLNRFGSDPAWGVPWLDGTGSSPVLVRLSRSAGLPTGLPDVNGVAIRLLDGRGGDLLLSNTGAGRLGRYLLVPHRHVGGVHTTIMPFATAAGPLLLRADLTGADEGGARARAVDRVRLPLTMTLSAATPRGPWRPFAHLTVTAPAGPVPDPPIAFDPLSDTIPGLAAYPWAAALRGRSYAAARAVRARTTG
ncbi:phosphodiesterase [Nakamurella deserti]|uniref:phosphodiesterase n=1 Tax=Nakamurella deserti TaxID=2164074 RepID=UPI0013005B6E|nr:phosphodiesterase [Nakamurella deserti]